MRSSPTLRTDYRTFVRTILVLVLGCTWMAHATQPPPATRQVAAGMADLLAAPTTKQVVFPIWLAKRIQTRTALFYFAPSCPHCQDAMPGVNELVEEGYMPWLGVAAASSTQMEIQAFERDFTPRFDIVQDDPERTFARAAGALSTPSVYVVEPLSADTKDATPGTLTVVEQYPPWPPGIEGLFRIRQHPEEPFRNFDRYVGMRTCMGCHTQEAQSWGLTHHAVAYRTLYMRDRAQDLQCVGCHVTGMDQPGGFEVGDHGSVLRDVTCEACHGPGGPHNANASPVDPKTSCVQCHDADHSIAFSVDKGLPHIDHFRSVGMTMDEMRERMMSMIDGEAPRPLLAFPEGPTVGAKTCKSCHKAAYKQWNQTPHSSAMKTLVSEEKSNVDCVRCHATAPASGGPEATDVHTYRTDESVGCESCHGSGKAHIDNPTKDNIVGLGESCPECVIESICTSCHTPKWDQGWDLPTRLPAVHH